MTMIEPQASATGRPISLHILVAVAALLPCSAPAQRAPAASVPHRSPLSLDVAGARLGMPHEQAKAAVAGIYRCETISNAPTFAEKVGDEVKKRRGQEAFRWGGTGVAEMDCKGPAGERLQLIFANGSMGPVVAVINFDAPLATVDRDAAVRQLAAKYGAPPIGKFGHGCWVESGNYCGLVEAGAKFSVEVDQSVIHINADRGISAKAADETAIQAAADRIAPKRNRAAF